MTSSNGGTGSTTDGNAFASFLLGYPSSLSTRESRLSVSTPLNVFTNYFGGFAQDDWRVSSKLTVNYGLRLEHENGLSEENNNFTVGWDPAMTSALSSITIPADPVAGTPARNVAGGLMYAGVDGNKTYQGNAPAVKWSPRVGAGLRVRPEDGDPRWLRPLLGAVQLSDPEHREQQLRSGGLLAEHHSDEQPRAIRHRSAIRSRPASRSRPATRAAR